MTRLAETLPARQREALAGLAQRAAANHAAAARALGVLPAPPATASELGNLSVAAHIADTRDATLAAFGVTHAEAGLCAHRPCAGHRRCTTRLTFTAPPAPTWDDADDL